MTEPDQASVRILLLNHNPRNLQLLAEYLGKEGFQTIIAQDLAQFDQALADSSTAIGAALVDIAGFDGQIWQRCELLRAAKIPFLVISPRHSAAIQQASLTHGARGVMVKPLVVKELVTLIHGVLE
jgi:DNA-binding response OmpR family regulator